jgi:hypothetical protein
MSGAVDPSAGGRSASLRSFARRDFLAAPLSSGSPKAWGSWSICPTSQTFKPDWGTAAAHLALGIRMAKALGSPAFRVVLGNQRIGSPREASPPGSPTR